MVLPSLSEHGLLKRPKDPSFEGFRGIGTSAKRLLLPRKKDYSAVNVSKERQELIAWAQAKQTEGKFTVGTNEVAEFIARAYVIHNAALAQKAGKKYEYTRELENALDALAKLRASNADLAKLSAKDAAIEMHKRISAVATGYLKGQANPLPVISNKRFNHGNCAAITMAHIMMARHPFKVENYEDHLHLVSIDRNGKRTSPYMGTSHNYPNGDVYHDPADVILNDYQTRHLRDELTRDPFYFPNSTKKYSSRSTVVAVAKKTVNQGKTLLAGAALLGLLGYGASFVKPVEVPINKAEPRVEVEISKDEQVATVKKATEVLQKAKQVIERDPQAEQVTSHSYGMEVARLARLKEAQNELHWSMAPTYTGGQDPSADKRILTEQGAMSSRLQKEIDAERSAVVKKVDAEIRSKMQSNPGYPNGLFDSLSAVDLHAAKRLIFDHLRELSNAQDFPRNLYHFRLFRSIALRINPDEVMQLGNELNPLVKALTFNEYAKMGAYIEGVNFSGELAKYKAAHLIGVSENVDKVSKLKDPYMKFAVLNQMTVYLTNPEGVPENKLELYKQIIDQMTIASRQFTEDEKKLSSKLIAERLFNIR